MYTGVGAINWLPDVRGWAEVVAALLAPGGRLYLRDMHPVLGALDETRDELVMGHPYFNTGEPTAWDDDKSYTEGEGTIAHSRHYGWPHGLGEVVTAVLDAGLAVTALEEHRELEWPFFEWMEPVGGGRYALPEPLRDRAPLMFTLQARKRRGDRPGRRVRRLPRGLDVERLDLLDLRIADAVARRNALVGSVVPLYEAERSLYAETQIAAQLEYLDTAWAPRRSRWCGPRPRRRRAPPTRQSAARCRTQHRQVRPAMGAAALQPPPQGRASDADEPRDVTEPQLAWQSRPGKSSHH